MKNLHTETLDSVCKLEEMIGGMKEWIEDYEYTRALEMYYEIEKNVKSTGETLKKMMGLI